MASCESASKALSLFEQLEHAGREDRRDRQQERESRGRFARQAARQAAQDRRPGSRCTGHQRGCLRTADHDRIRPSPPRLHRARGFAAASRRRTHHSASAKSSATPASAALITYSDRSDVLI